MMRAERGEAIFAPTRQEVPKSERELAEGMVNGLGQVADVLREAIEQGRTEGVEAGLARIFGPDGVEALRVYLEGQNPMKTEEAPTKEPMSEEVPEDISAQGQLNRLRELFDLPQAK